MGNRLPIQSELGWSTGNQGDQFSLQMDVTSFYSCKHKQNEEKRYSSHTYILYTLFALLVDLQLGDTAWNWLTWRGRPRQYMLTVCYVVFYRHLDPDIVWRVFPRQQMAFDFTKTCWQVTLYYISCKQISSSCPGPFQAGYEASKQILQL